MRRSQRLIAACRPRRAFRRAGRLRQHGQFRSDRHARLPRHQEEAAGRAQAGVPRRRARPRAGRAEGSLQGLPPAADRPSRTPGGCRRSRRRRSRNPRAAKSKGRRSRPPRPRAARRRRSRCRAGGRGQHRRGTAGAEAGQDRAPAHHRAAARSAGPAQRRSPRSNNPPPVPGADAERLVLRVDFVPPFD